MNTSKTDWDDIVIGSGIGGLACAAALARTGHRALVLERHSIAGGLTQTFHRDGFVWDVGVHYLTEVGPNGFVRAILDWITGGTLKFVSTGAVYDTLHFPEDFEFKFSSPEAALKNALKEQFPSSSSEIDAVFNAFSAAYTAGKALFASHAMPKRLAELYEWRHRKKIRKWWARSLAEVLDELISDPKLRTVLAAVWGDHGGLPKNASFGIHAMVVRGFYMEGGYYPVGGARAFADELIPVIERAGGAVKLRAPVSRILIENGVAAGVELEDGTRFRARRVFSDAGALNTVGRLLPIELRESSWAKDVRSFEPSICHIALYLGFEGDVKANGANTSNHWFSDSWNLDYFWRDLSSEPPGYFVSFPSLKNPSHDPGKKQRHTAEIVALTTWDAFSPWKDSSHRQRPKDYSVLKAELESKLLAQFRRRFPALAPMVVYHEASTPLTTSDFIGSPEGGIYGLEVSPRRFLASSLRPRTPVPKLYLAGQDACVIGVSGAFLGGFIAALAAEPKLLAHLPWSLIVI